MASTKFDVIVIGGGVMGGSTAYHLVKNNQGIKVAVIEKDPTYQRASSTLSMGNVRIQFSLKENILISLYAFQAYESFEEEMEIDGDRPSISYKREGNLFLYDQATIEAGREAFELQKSLGCPIQWWSPDQAREAYPLYKTDGFVGCAFGAMDGHIDGYSVVTGYKNKARSLGARYFNDEVVKIDVSQGGIDGVRTASGEHFQAPIVVNCAGAWAADVGRAAGIDIPVAPTKRNVYSLDTAVKPEGPLPLTILPSGLYFRTETGGSILLGKSLPEDPVGYDFVWERDRFQDVLWEELAEFVPAFDTLKLTRGWAGLYEVNTLDGNGILGQWPELKGFYLANGFSGHGLQQGPAVGRYLSELILGLTPLLDLTLFSPRRILENKPLSEGGIV